MPREFSLFSPELVVNILQSLSSFKDLHAITRASSKFYRVFTEYKQSILSTLVLRAISREIEADFILAYRAQRIWDFVFDGNVELQRQQIENGNLLEKLSQESIAILDQFKSEKDERLSDLVSNRTLLLDIWKFYSNFEHLMTCYSTRALSNLHLRESRLDFNGSLSRTEWTRLQRSFFRCEMYTCLFQISQATGRNNWRPAPSSDPASRFAAKLCSWEVEELFCVAQFYQVLTEELCDRIEEDLVTAVKEKTIARAANSFEKRDDEAEDDESEDDESEDAIDTLNWLGICWFGESHRRSHRPRHIEFLISRGMRGVRKLTSAPLPIARKMILSSDLLPHRHFPLFTPVPYSYPDGHEAGAAEERVEGTDLDENSLEHCNFGWLWAGGDAYAINMRANHELRNEGYVFWDKARLLEFEQFRSSREPVEDLLEFPAGYQEHSERPGAESKLKNTPIHYDDMRDIADDYVFHQDDNGGEYVIKWRD